MKKCSVVIGSLWGDEGKGHITDILCSSATNVLNVRFNGGAQASHTVVTPKGERYAFRHTGAGTFSGADTYLSGDFIVNPMLFVEETRVLWEKFGIIPQVYINPNAIVTNFWDIFINQVVELNRGEKRHGSCGLGINETVVRSQEFKYRIFVSDLFDSRKLLPKLTKIREEYVPARLEQHGLKLEQLDEEWKRRFDKYESIELFSIFCDEFIKVAKIADNDIINDYDNVVFEGAQGLLLDQHSQFWPHVTRSNTGLKNVMKLLQNINVKEKIDIYYMCRCYATKHGAGPFPGEFDVRTYANVVDETNIPNEFQGSLRLGVLDLDLLASAINKDLGFLNVDSNVNICITCMDQILADVCYIANCTNKTSSKEEFISNFKFYMKEKLTLFNCLYITNGLTRKDFSEV